MVRYILRDHYCESFESCHLQYYVIRGFTRMYCRRLVFFFYAAFFIIIIHTYIFILCILRQTHTRTTAILFFAFIIRFNCNCNRNISIDFELAVQSITAAAVTVHAQYNNKYLQAISIFCGMKKNFLFNNIKLFPTAKELFRMHLYLKDRKTEKWS